MAIWHGISFSLLSRVHQHTCAVLQHILYVLSHWAGHMAGLLLAALFQGKEADWVKQPQAPCIWGKLLSGQPTHPSIHPPWTSFSKQQQVGLRGSNSSLDDCESEFQDPPLEKKKKKKDSPAYLVVWNMKSAVGRNLLCEVCVCSISTVLDVSVCTVFNVAAYWIRTCSLNQLNDVWAQFEWMCHERMSFCPFVDVHILCHAKQSRSLVPFYQVKANG